MSKAVRIILVRHGEAAAKWGESKDPGLSEQGQLQARRVAEEIHKQTGPLALYTSPLKRAVETMAPIQVIRDSQSVIVPALTEIPANHIPMEKRKTWLAELKHSGWSSQPEQLKVWRQGIIDFLLNCAEDSLMTTHFAVINVAVGQALGLEDIFSFQPANCSATVFDVIDRKLHLIEKGSEAQSMINL